MDNKRHISFIDGLKGICCLMVFMCHFRMMGFLPQWPIFNNPFVSVLLWGDLAVCVFILLSSFLICLSFYSNKEKNTVSIMILKRYFRLSIPIGIIVVLIGIINHSGLQCNQAAAALNGNEHLYNIMKVASLSSIIKDVFLIPLGHSSLLLPQAWMIKYIFYGTFMTIALVTVSEKIKPIKSISLGIFFAVLFGFIDVYYVNVIVGFLFFKCYQSNLFEDRKISYISIINICLFILLRFLIPNQLLGAKGYAGTIYAIIIVIVMFSTKWTRRLFSTSSLLWLGKISFSLYLWHIVILFTFTSWLYLITNDLSNIYRLPLLFVSTAILLLLVSWLSQNIIEKKLANILLKRIILFFET